MSTVRRPVLAGSWYPADPDGLARQVDGFLAQAQAGQRPAGRPLVAVVPHAGYAYSGPTAGRVYGLLRGDAPRRAVILAPNHRAPLSRPALSGADAFATPLGQTPVDTAAVALLAADGACAVDDRAHAAEHAVEIQLPFLQRLWPDAAPAIVPVLVPPLEPARREAAARALGRLLDDGTLLVVSTDFTHYGAPYGYTPFSDDVPHALERLDSGAILKILAGDAPGLLDYGRRTGITMCGLEAAALALRCGLPDGYEGALIDYARSGDRDGDYSMSVSYAGILLGSGPAPAGPPEGARP